MKNDMRCSDSEKMHGEDISISVSMYAFEEADIFLKDTRDGHKKSATS